MGLAASQARLLTITARLADNELRSQTINNAKMRLATQSAQASEKYVNALNESDMMFQNTMIDGTYQNQLLTFNSLTAYSPYNTQYGLVNSAGLTLVSEAEANMFVAAGGNLEKFLNLHGLEWGTTYFDHVNTAELEAAMGEDYATIFGSIAFDPTTGLDLQGYETSSIEEYLKAAYEHYEAYQGSLEYAQFTESSQNFLAELRNYNKKFEKWIVGEKYGTEGSRLSASQVVQNMMVDYDRTVPYESAPYNSSDINSKGNQIRRNIVNSWPTGYSNCPKRVIAYILKNLSDDFLTNYFLDSSGNYSAANFSKLFQNPLNPNSTPIANMTVNSVTINSNLYYEVTGSADTIDISTLPYDSATGIYSLSNGDDKESGNVIMTFKKDASGNFYIVSCAPPVSKDSNQEAHDESEEGYLKYVINGSNLEIHNYYKIEDDAYQALIQDIMDEFLTSDIITFDFFSREDSSLVDLGGVIAGMDPETQKDDIMNYLRALLGSGSDNEDFMSKMRHLAYIEDLMGLYYDETTGALRDPSMAPSDELQNLFDMYRVEAMVSVYGEPKYSWIDKNDTGNTGNPDSKAQWLTNLFERMKRGYRILEDGLASSNDWIEYALKSGLVTVEQVDSSHNWVNIDYKTCAGITEQTDRSALVAKAEAEYNRAMNDIKQKDSIYDLQLKNIDTEHSSLMQEYDSIQKVINKNIERTMKFDQNG